MSTRPQDDQLSGLLMEAEDALQAGQLRPENTELLVRILSPLERAVAQLPEAPSNEQGAAGPIPNLLWCKAHPATADGAIVLRQVASETPVVRMLAASALTELLEYSPDPKLLYRAKTALKKQIGTETSPVVNLLLKDLLLRIAQLTASARMTPPEAVFAPSSAAPPEAVFAPSSAAPPVRPSARTPAPVAVKLNPYNAGLPIRDRARFFGRTKILDQIGVILGSDEGVKSVLLVGARRTGKTSLLYQIAGGALGNRFIASHVDLQALSTPDFDGLLRLMVKSLTEMCARAGAPPTPGIGGNPYEVAKATIAHACNTFADRRVLILVDEYEVLEEVFHDQQHAVRLHGILENEQRLFFVFAGAQKPESLSPRGVLVLLDNSRTINISFLEPEEARQLITQQLGDYLTYDTAAIELIQVLCHGHPFYTQLLCQMIFDAKPGGGVVSEADINSVVQQFMRNPSAHTILTWKNLTRKQKLTAACVAAWTDGRSYIGAQQIQAKLAVERYPGAPSQHELQRGLRDLQELDLLEKQEGEASFRFTMDLLRRWIAESRTIWDVKQESGADYVPASLGRRLAALAVDWLVSTGISFGLYQVSPTVWSPAVVLLLYFAVVSAVADRTLGMRQLGLRVLRVDGRTLHSLRMAILGAIGAIECALPTSILLMLYPGSPWASIGSAWRVLVPLCAIEAIHLARIGVNRRHQGLYEAIVDAVVVREEEGA